MAGHSKWKNIQHRKGRQDAAKGKIFTKLIREITVSARQGGEDPNTNPRLRLAMDKALSNNMPKDTILRAIKRGIGNEEGSHFEEIRYEGYGPAGVAFIVDCMSDNKNRTVGEVRYAFTRHNGNLGATGSVAYLFKMQGLLCFPPGNNGERIFEIALDAGAEDVISNDDGSIDVFTAPENFTKIKEAMIAAKLNPSEAEIGLFPTNEITLDKENADKVLHLIEALEELDDVQNVYTNANFP
jgi:YebC/PmpR family DNA-binding regulatory protein